MEKDIYQVLKNVFSGVEDGDIFVVKPQEFKELGFEYALRPRYKLVEPIAIKFEVDRSRGFPFSAKIFPYYIGINLVKFYSRRKHLLNNINKRFFEYEVKRVEADKCVEFLRNEIYRIAGRKFYISTFNSDLQNIIHHLSIYIALMFGFHEKLDESLEGMLYVKLTPQLSEILKPFFNIFHSEYEYIIPEDVVGFDVTVWIDREDRKVFHCTIEIVIPGKKIDIPGFLLPLYLVSPHDCFNYVGRLVEAIEGAVNVSEEIMNNFYNSDVYFKTLLYKFL